MKKVLPSGEQFEEQKREAISENVPHSESAHELMMRKRRQTAPDEIKPRVAKEPRIVERQGQVAYGKPRRVAVGQSHGRIQEEHRREGPGNQPLPIPKKPTTRIPKKSLMGFIKEMHDRQLGRK